MEWLSVEGAGGMRVGPSRSSIRSERLEVEVGMDGRGAGGSMAIGDSTLRVSGTGVASCLSSASQSCNELSAERRRARSCCIRSDPEDGFHSDLAALPVAHGSGTSSLGDELPDESSSGCRCRHRLLVHAGPPLDFEGACGWSASSRDRCPYRAFLPPTPLSARNAVSPPIPPRSVVAPDTPGLTPDSTPPCIP
jgi:hypothetical protein